MELTGKFFTPIQPAFQQDISQIDYTPISATGRPSPTEILDATKDPIMDKAMGCFMGMLVGDTLGAPLEFISPRYRHQAFLEYPDMEYHSPYNKFGINLGQWTDDSSMGLCLADSLLLCQGFDGADVRRRFYTWWFHGYNNAFRLEEKRLRRTSVGLGYGVSMSLREMQEEPVSPISNTTSNSGNGSLMRLASVPIFYLDNLDDAMKYARLSSLTSHGGSYAGEACVFASYVMVHAMKGKYTSIQHFLDSVVESYSAICTEPKMLALLAGAESPTSTEFCWNWKSEDVSIMETIANRGRRYNGHPVSDTYFASYVMDALAVALHCLYTTNTAMDAIVKAVNYLGDADTTGAITGQFAGAFYGYSALDKRVLDAIDSWSNGDHVIRAMLLRRKQYTVV